MAAKSKPVETLTVSDLGLSADDVAATDGDRGRRRPAEAGRRDVEFDDTTAARIADLLAEAKVI